MMWRIAAAGLLSAVVGVVLSEMGFKGKRIFAAVCFTLLITAAFGESSEMFGKIIGFADGAGIGRVARTALKVVGVGYVFGFGEDICRELGENGAASAMAMAAKIEILILVFPYFMEILELGLSAIG